MSTLRSGIRLSLIAALTAAPALAVAQSSTGIDGTWMAAYKTAAASSYGIPFVAYVVNPQPGPWQDNTADYKWIGAAPDGTVDGQYGDGQPRYDYLFSTVFNLANPTTITFTCAMDNSLGEMIVNGAPAVPGGCGTFLFGPTQTLTLGAGSNSLAFHVQGDGTTDGLLLNVTSVVTATPEPASLTLIATGLLGVFGAARRRRATLQG